MVGICLWNCTDLRRVKPSFNAYWVRWCWVEETHMSEASICNKNFANHDSYNFKI